MEALCGMRSATCCTTDRSIVGGGEREAIVLRMFNMLWVAIGLDHYFTFLIADSELGMNIRNIHIIMTQEMCLICELFNTYLSTVIRMTIPHILFSLTPEVKIVADILIVILVYQK
jgi:hypothetical protein